MKKKKLTLEDLKLESFLTELDDSKLIKVQGGMGGYETETEQDTEQDQNTEQDGGSQGTPYDDEDLMNNITTDEDPTNYTPHYDDTPYTDEDLMNNITTDEDPTNYTPEYGDSYNC
jgi:hypothetical protein